MKINKYLIYYNTFSAIKELLSTYPGLKLPQLIVFGAIIAISEHNSVVSQYDVTLLNTSLNKALSKSTTQRHINRLESEGFIVKTKNPQYFSRSYITLTKEGLLLKSRLSSLLNRSF